MRAIPPELLGGPFTRDYAATLGVSSRMLEGRRFVRIHPRVWRHRDHEMTAHDHVRAAALALPAHAHTTGITRIQQLGLDFGPHRPLRFVVPGDLHLALDGIFLHRTRALPPTDGVGVAPAGAFVAFCARARVLDAIKVGDWLLHHEHMGLAEVRDLALAQLWRDGAHETVWILDHLDAGSRSVRESEVRALLAFSGLPRPRVNVDVGLGGRRVIGDLVLEEWGLVVEYEGLQHQTDRDQYVLDLSRYAEMRRASLGYVQVTHEHLRTPRVMVGRVYQALVERGYGGAPPTFGERWRSLFVRVSDLIGNDVRVRRRAVA